MARLSALGVGRTSKWVVVGVWLAAAAAVLPLQGKLQERAADESDTFMVRGSESAAAKRTIDERFRRGSELAAIVAYVRDGGLTAADQRRMDADARAACASRAIPSLTLVSTPQALACGRSDPLDVGPGAALLRSSDGSVALTSVLMTDDSTPIAEAAVATLRGIVPPPGGDRTGLRAYVTGEAGFDADRSEAVKQIDDTLLGITIVALLALLLAIYRSPVAALVPLVVVGVAYLVTAGVVYGLVAAGVTTASGQTTAILIVLMFGAGTDYCVLLVARFREELDRTPDMRAALVRAAARSGPAILSAGAIVVVTMLALAVADFNATREMGPVLALGVAIMVVAGLTLLPAILAILGPRAFWPGGAPPAARGALWSRVAGAVRRRPAPIAVAVTALLIAGSLGNLGGREPLGFADAFRDRPQSVDGEQVIRDHFAPGRASPVRVVTDVAASDEVIAALSTGLRTPVQEMYVMARSAGDAAPLALSDAYLRTDPFSDAAIDAMPELRASARAAARGTPLQIGGAVAEAYDTRRALRRDTAVIVPLGLALILLILAVLLRALVMPLYVVGTVILSFAFALGASSLIFTHVLGEPASDPSLALFAFVFLVALGVDYNVFLVARIREERTHAATADAVRIALARTGGVITSAGLVLAVTFGVLMALPIQALFQVGFVVALGLLVDTFLVRALLVPAIATLLGDMNWWPQRSFANHRAKCVDTSTQEA
jgi:RND superfamily putative drug exporter